MTTQGNDSRKEGTKVTNAIVQQKARTIFDVVPQFSELMYKLDIARGVSEAEAEKTREHFKQFDMTTERFLRECGASEC